VTGAAPSPPAGPRGGAGRSGLRVALGVLYAVATLPAAAFLAFAGVFALSPTECPDVGGSYLCTSTAGGLATLAAVGFLLLAFVGLGLAVPFAGTSGRAWRRVLASAACAAAALGVQLAALSTWT
jgi:hypothetical protein